MITLTKPVFEKLIEHLINIEESSESMADFYFPDSPEDREEIMDFFSVYIKKIECEMEHVEVINPFTKVPNYDILNTFPFVIIGSEVSLETFSDKTVYSCRIIQPDSHTKAKNVVTFLSPLGRSLLLRRTGSEIVIGTDNKGNNINAPDTSAQTQRAMIKSIKLLAG